MDLLADQEWIQSLAERLVRDPALAEDAAQETLLDGVRQGWLGRGVSRAWLAGAVRNKVRLRLREEGRRRARERRSARDEVETARAEMVDRAEAHRQLVAEVLALREPHRTVLLERYFEGLSTAEIARREGRSKDTVTRRLTRAHAALRERLERRGGEADWLGALVPLLPDRTLAVSTVLVPVVAMKLSAAAAAAVALILLALTAVPRGHPDATETAATAPEADRAVDTAPTKSATLDVLDTVERVRVDTDSTASTTAVTASLTASIRVADGQPAADFELRLEGGEQRTASAIADELGQLTLDHLLVAEPLQPSLWKDGERWSSELDPLHLEAGENEHTFTVHLRTVVHGRAVDDDGHPVAGEELVLRPSRGFEREVGRRLDPNDIVATTHSDRDGHFAFEPVAPGDYMIGPRGRTFSESTDADGLLSIRRIANPTASHLRALEVPRGADAIATEVVVHRGHSIAGRVIYPDGSPVSDVVLVAVQTGLSGTFRADSGEDGSFKFETMAPGEYRVFDTSSPEAWGVFTPARASTGTTDMEIVLEPAGILSGRAIDRSTGQSVDGWLSVLCDESSPTPGSGVAIQFNDGGDGEFRVESLPPTTHVLYFESTDKTRYGLVRRVLVTGGHELTDIAVDVRAAAPLSVVNRGTETVDFAVLLPDGGFLMDYLVKPGESFDVAVPPDGVRVVFERGGDVVHQVDLDTVAGEPCQAVYQP